MPRDSLISDMNTFINGKSTNATEFAYDGCHKIYLIEDDQAETMFKAEQWSIYPIADLENIWQRSCFLRFVEGWCGGEEPQAYTRYVEQGDDLVLDDPNFVPAPQANEEEIAGLIGQLTQMGIPPDMVFDLNIADVDKMIGEHPDWASEAFRTNGIEME